MKNLDILILLYSKVTKDCEIAKLGEMLYYYYADKMSPDLSNDLSFSVIFENVISVDIQKCHITICKHYFPELYNELITIEDKTERSKKLSIFLKEQRLQSINNRDYIKEFDNIAKIVSLGYIYNNYKDIHIIEYQKDGATFYTSDKLDYPLEPEFNSIIEELGFKFHILNLRYYFRFNKITVKLTSDNDVVVKGEKYKNPPEFITDVFFKEIFKLDNKFLNKIKSIYSKQFHDIIKELKLYKELKYYYYFNNVEVPYNEILLEFIYKIIGLLKLL